ncbi:MAG: 50S ribosomal protein P1 [Candidatus Aenigmatarchaeota archaeon]
MNYIYSVLLLHSAGKEINEENVKKIISAIEQPDESRIKALVAALEGVNIDEVISKAAMPTIMPVTTVPGEEKKEEKPKEEEIEKKVEEAASGLASLFG